MRAIIACDDTGGIGLNGSMPWPSLDGDLARFRSLTEGSAVIMGRKTWEASDMPSPIPNRLNVVISKDDLHLPVNVLQLTSLKYFRCFDRESWIIGGASLLASSMHLVTHVHLTRVPGDYKCDTHINLKTIEDQFTRITINHNSDHDYELWVRTKYST